VAVEEGRAELPQERLAEFRQIGSEIRGGKAQEPMHGTRHVAQPPAERPLRVQREPRPDDQRSGAVARDVDALLAKPQPMIAVELVGEVAKGRLIVHAAVVEIKDVFPLVQPLGDKEVSEAGEAGRAV